MKHIDLKKFKERVKILYFDFYLNLEFPTLLNEIEKEIDKYENDNNK